MKKLVSNIIITLLLICGLVITTMALTNEILIFKDNTFSTGTIKININDGKKLNFKDKEGKEIAYFEAGMTAVSDFFVKNEGTNDMYYRLYFDNVSGDLKDEFIITVKDGSSTLYQGEIKTAPIDCGILKQGEKKVLSVSFKFKDNSNAQAKDLTFNLKAEGTQVKNNPERKY